MALTVQNLRAVGTGVEPASLLPGQIAFNVTDKVLFVGDGSNVKTAFDGTQTPGVPGGGWYAMPMDFASLGDYYVANPGYWGDVPTDQQVLTWSTALNHPIWTSGGGGGGGNQVYVVTNAAVAAAPGATTSAKITAAIGVASPDEGDVTIVTGLPDDVYEGLYFFTTEWVKGAAYAYPSASEVIYNNTGRTLGATVQLAIDDLDDGLIATTAIANTANSTANSALSIASAALPKAGGTMTGTIVARSIDVQSGYNLQFLGSGYIAFNAGANGTITGITDAVSSTSSTLAGSANAVRLTYDLANAALPRSGGTMTGAITFVAGQVFPVSGIQDATTSQKGVVRVGTNIDVAAGVISVPAATGASNGVVTVGNNIQVAAGVISVLDSSTTQKGVVQLVNNTSSPGATDQALTAAMGASLQTQLNGITISGTVTLAGSIDANTGFIQSVTTQGAAANFVVGQVLPAAAPDPSPPGNNNYYVIVTNPGTFTPPGGTPVTSENGDWILSDGVTWQELAVGARPAYASTSSAGVIALSDNAQTQTGTNNLLAVTPATLQSKLSNSTSLTSSTTIASSTAVKAAYDLAAAAIPCSTITAVGDIVVGGAGPAPTALPVGANGQVLVANSACATGLEWVSDTPGDVTSVTATSPVTADNTDPQNPVIGIDAASTTQSGAVQLNDTVTSTSTTEAATANAAKTAYDKGVAACTVAQAAVPNASFLAKGNLLAGTGSATYGALGVGANGQVLIADSGTATGLIWGNACYVPDTCFTAKGQLIVGTGAGAYTALSPGSNGQLLVPNSACANGVEWVTRASLDICGFTCTATPFNTALGSLAGAALTVNSVANTAIGYAALDAETSGDFNVAVGHNALTAQNGATGNVAVGANAGAAITSGANNILVGYGAGDSLTIGSANVAVGKDALASSTGASNSVAIGNLALTAVTTGANNVGVGAAAGAQVNTGASNTLLGATAGDCVTSGSFNVAVGFNSLGAVSANGNNVAVGSCALAVSTAPNLVAVGHNALLSNTSGTANTALGYTALSLNITGSQSTAVGFGAGQCVSGNANTLIGYNAGNDITTGICNTILGSVTGTTTLSCNLILAAASTIKFQANASGAWSPDGTNYGTIGQVLTSQGTVAAPAWCTLSLACVPCAAYTAVGDILIGTGAATFSALPVGTNGQVLVPNSTCSTGLEWITATALSLVGYTCSATPFNTAIGAGAGDSITSGTANTSIGFNAGTALTTGDGNTVIGRNAGAAVTGIANLTAIGNNSVVNAATGAGTTAVGANTLSTLTSGANNTAVGAFAGTAVTTGGCNTLVGASAGDSISTASNNVAVGFEAGCSLTTNGSNTFVGSCAGRLQTSTNNTALGANALANTGVNNNTGLGFNAGCSLTTGGSNTFVGAGAGDAATTADNAVAVGFNALGGVATAAGSVAVGVNALAATTSGDNSVAIGFNAGAANTAGAQNVLVGTGAGQTANATGLVFVGFCAGQANTTAGCGTYLGYVSGRNATGLSNTYVGALTGCAASNTSACGTLLGFCAGSALTTGNGNNFIGFQAGRNVNTGGFNVAIGTAAFQTATTAANNVAVGCGALSGLSTTSGNTALGHRAMINASTAANNVVVGCSAGEQISSGSTNVFIGNTAGDAVTTGSSNTIIGDIAGSAALTGNLILAAGTTQKLQVNENGAVGVGSTPSYGTAGQVLQSAGTGAAPTWTTPIWQPLTTLTTTSTTSTTLLSVPVASTRAVFIDVSVSDATGGNYHTDSYQVVTDGTSTDDQQIPGARLGTNPYTLTSAVVGADLVISVTSASANSTKYVGSYQTIAV